MNPNILLLEYISKEALEILYRQVNIHEASTLQESLDLAAKMPITAIVTRGSGVVDKQLIKQCKGLKVIARCGVGLDNVDTDSASKEGVMVINAPGSNADTVAEHTLALMLSAQRQIPTYAQIAKNNNWVRRSQYGGDEIRGKTLGIVGLGNIGKKVATLATAFGMSVQYWNRTIRTNPYQQVDFDTLLTTSDIISLHLPKIAATHHLIAESAFQKMKPTVLLVNTARGSIIQESALIQALENRRIAGFAADVLENEPPVENHPLLQFPTVLLTPHTASLTATTFNEMCVITVQNVVDLLVGKAIEERFIFNRAAL